MQTSNRSIRAEERLSWVPTADKQEAVKVLLAGLQLIPGDRLRSQVWTRIRGELPAAGIRTDLLGDLLPVPDSTIPTDAIVRFRERRGPLLPALRRYLEAQIDNALKEDDEDLRLRKLDRLVEEVDDRVKQAEAYLREAGLRRISRSPLIRICKLIPGLGKYVAATREVAESMETISNFEAEPLAYLAFARVTFPLAKPERVDPWTGLPLVTAMGHAAG